MWQNKLISVLSVAVWTVWTAWTYCSAFCGGGYSSRRRRCSTGRNCEGENVDAKECNTETCPGERLFMAIVCAGTTSRLNILTPSDERTTNASACQQSQFNILTECIYTSDLSIDLLNLSDENAFENVYLSLLSCAMFSLSSLYTTFLS